MMATMSKRNPVLECTRVLSAVLLLALLLGACTEASRTGVPSADGGRLDLSGGASWFKASCDLPVRWLRRIQRGFFSSRGPNLTFVPHQGNPIGNFDFSTTHSGPWPFLQRVPLLFYGPAFIKAQGPLEMPREVTLADIVPTVAGLIDSPVPGSSVGKSLLKDMRLPTSLTERPKLVVTVVWDGGGSNVLERWRSSTPFLNSLIPRGTLVSNATVGTSPSVTPAVHGTIGTGAFPNRHGLVNILQREGDHMTASFGGLDPDNLEAQTLADVYDRSTQNEAKIAIVAKDAMHLGMMGHGAFSTGGDHDIAALTAVENQTEFLGTNSDWYSLPTYLNPTIETDVTAAMRVVDRTDGKLDNEWLGHPLPINPEEQRGFNNAPVWTILQTQVSENLLKREHFGRDSIPDLFYTNYKDPDYVGHAFNFYSDEVGETVRYADKALRELVSFLNNSLGKNQWVLVFTADHGQAPLPQAVGTWPISVGNLTSAVGRFVGVPKEQLIDHVKQNGIWFKPGALSESGVRLRDVAAFLMGYRIRDNAEQQVPAAYSDRLDEPIFDAVFPSSQTPRVSRCARESTS